MHKRTGEDEQAAQKISQNFDKVFMTLAGVLALADVPASRPIKIK